jgi:uncharacterized protein DUF6159
MYGQHTFSDHHAGGTTVGNRFSRGLRIVAASWRVLRQDKKLLVLPLVSLIATALALVPLAFELKGSGLPNDGTSPAHWVILAIYLFVASLIATFFNATIIAAATIRLGGGVPTLGGALGFAFSKIHKIVAWAFISAIVGLVAQLIVRRIGFLGRLMVVIFGAAWSAVTFFVVPVLLFEDVGAIASVKRSGSLFRQKWGEQFVGDAAIGLVLGAFAMIPITVGAAVAAAGAFVLGIAIMAATVLTLIIVSGALSGIFTAALYRYASTGQISQQFAAMDLDAAFRPRRRR